MKNAPFEEVPVAADAKDEASIAARKRLSAVLAELNPGAGFKVEGDGRGSKKQKKPKKSEEPAVKPKSMDTPPAETLSGEEQERAGKFDRLDKDKVGSLTREYYTTHQSDAAAAGERFDKYDSDKDGLVSRDEYIFKGKKAKP